MKKQPDDELLDDGETQVYLTNDDGDSMQANNEMYVIEQVGAGDMTESEGDEYVEFEMEANKSDDRMGGDGGIESIDENSLLTAPEFEYVSSHRSRPAAKRMRESAGTPHEFTTSTTYRRTSGGGGGCGSIGVTSSSYDRSLTDLHKKLMQEEFDHKKKLRDEKHQLEIAILKADLTNKTLEHQKQMELLNKKLQE